MSSNSQHNPCRVSVLPEQGSIFQWKAIQHRHFIHTKKHGTSKTQWAETLSSSDVINVDNMSQSGKSTLTQVQLSHWNKLQWNMFLHVASSTRTSCRQRFREQFCGAGTQAASSLDITAAHSTAPGIAFDSCTEDKHAQRVVSSVTTLQASKETDALPRKGSHVWLKGFFNEQEPYVFFKSSCKTGWVAVSEINIWNLQKISVSVANVEGKWIQATSWSTKGVPIHKGSVLSSWKTEIN